jgi:carbamoyl-phosphate synthase small subunit
MVRCFLVLEDGTVLDGVSFGHEGAVLGELVFTTSMSGYQEDLSDPAYKGQILVSSFPLVGCYGVSDAFGMSDAVQASGCVVKEYCEEPSDMYGGRTLGEYLRKHRVPGISGVDTRDIVIRIRENGAMNAAIVFDEKDIAAMKKKLKEKRGKENLVRSVSCKGIKKISNGRPVSIGLIDCGADRGLISDLSEMFDLVIFPYDVKAKDIIGSNVKGVVISNGPGDPGHPDIAGSLVRTIKELPPSMPLAGIGLGAQAIAVAFGCKTVKLKFGHHGSSQPVKHGTRVHITHQNHMYTVDPDSMDGTGLIADQFNVNDGTLEGFSHRTLPVFGIQYYPVSPRYENDSFFYSSLEKLTGGRK